ncbi:MAG: DUF4349 domain-containing protein [Lachnospiraceae bacterium]|nr:DUF4349 domain-containing protein [Lachnospiraceae bacterium]
MKGLWKKVWICGMCMTLLLTGCGGSGGSYSSLQYESNGGAYYADLGGYDSAEIYDSAATESNTASGTQNVREGRKLIRTVRLEVETLEFDELLAYVQNKTAELGGYIESMNVYNGNGYTTYYGNGYRQDRNASLTLRIPKDNLDGFLTEVDDRGNVISRSEQEVDVTLDYVDLDSHKQVLLAEQERLLSMMEKAETIDDLITLESRLSDIRYQIESMESRLRTYDNQIEYSTVYLYLNEVVELTPIVVEEKSAWERMGDGFMESLKNIGIGLREFGIGFVINIPYLLLMLIIVGFIIWLILFIVKKSNSSQQKKLAAQRELVQKQQEEYARRQAELKQQQAKQQVGQPQQQPVQQPGGQPGQQQ